MKYYRFQLLISSAAPADGYMVHALTPRGQGRAQFNLPFLLGEGGTLRAMLNEREFRSHGAEPRLSPNGVGEQLFRALFQGEILRLYERNLDLLGADPEVGLRLELTLDPRDSNLRGVQALPWELLRQPGTPEFLALNRRLPVTRFLAVPRPVYAAPRPNTLRILAVTAAVRHASLSPLDLDRELTNLRQAVGSVAEVATPEAPTLAALHMALSERQFHVLHFMGHGSSLGEERVLFFATEDGSPDPVKGIDLVNQLAGFPTVRLVVLNACHSAAMGDARTTDEDTNAFAGVANTLVLGGLPAVIAMQLPISDDAAIAFSRAFYRQLAAGDPVDTAVSEGRQAVHSLDRSSSEWATPVLFLRTPTGELYPEGNVWDPSTHTKQSRRWIAILFMGVLILSLGSILFNWPLRLGEIMIRRLDPDSKGSERPTTPPLEASVLGFRNLSGQGAEWISVLLSDRVEAELAGGDGLHVTGRDGLALEGVSARTGGCSSEGDLRRVRESHGVDFVVSGSYLVYGDPPDSLLQLDICIQDTRTAQPLATKSLRTRAEEASAVASDVAAFFRTSLDLAPVPRNDASVPATHHSASAEATEAYYEGLLYLQRFDPLLARDSFKRALAADPGYAVAHAGLAEAWSLLGYDDEARKSAHKALELLAGAGAPSARFSTDAFGEFQMIRARAHESAWEWDEAIAAYRGLWKFATHTGRPEAKDYGLLLLAAQIKGERMKGAVETISWLHKIPLTRVEAVEIALAEAAVARSFGDSEEQAKQAAKAVRIAQELRAPLLAARADLFWCDALVRLGSYQEGLPRCEAARQQFVGVGDVLNTAKAESVIAVANALQGDFDAAMYGIQKIRDIFDTTGYGRGIAEQLNNLANLMGERGSWKQAKKTLLEARRIAGERDDHRLLAEISVNLAGIVFWDEREYSDALSLYRSALSSYERIGAEEKAFLTRGDIAYMLQVQGEHLGARKEYEEACRGLERLRSQGADAADVLLRFARLCAESGDNQRARRLLVSARRYYSTNGEMEREAMMQSDLNEILGSGPPEWQQILRLPLTNVTVEGSPCS